MKLKLNNLKIIALYRAISRPIPLVDPVTMQVRSLTGGKGRGFCKWLANILWNSISYMTYNQPLSHSIHPRASFLLLLLISSAADGDEVEEEDDVVSISRPLSGASFLFFYFFQRISSKICLFRFCSFCEWGVEKREEHLLIYCFQESN